MECGAASCSLENVFVIAWILVYHKQFLSITVLSKINQINNSTHVSYELWLIW